MLRGSIEWMTKYAMKPPYQIAVYIYVNDNPEVYYWSFMYPKKEYATMKEALEGIERLKRNQGEWIYAPFSSGTDLNNSCEPCK